MCAVGLLTCTRMDFLHNDMVKGKIVGSEILLLCQNCKALDFRQNKQIRKLKINIDFRN